MNPLLSNKSEIEKDRLNPPHVNGQPALSFPGQPPSLSSTANNLSQISQLAQGQLHSSQQNAAHNFTSFQQTQLFVHQSLSTTEANVKSRQLRPLTFLPPPQITSTLPPLHAITRSNTTNNSAAPSQLSALGTLISAGTHQNMRDNLYERMIDAHAVRQGFDAIGHVFTAAFHHVGSTIKQGVVKTCSLNSTTRSICTKIADETTKLGVSLVKPVVQKLQQSGAIDFVRHTFSSLSQQHAQSTERAIREFEDRFQISPEMTRQFMRDNTHILLTVGLPTVVSKALKTMKAAYKALRTVPRISSPPIVPSNTNFPNAIRRMSREIDRITEAHPTRPFIMLDKATENHLFRQFPNLSRFEDTQERVWRSALNIVEEPSIHYFTRGDHTVAKLSAPTQTFIIKDSVHREAILSELRSIQFLESLHLEHLAIPQVYAIGRYGTVYPNYFIAKSFLPGQTLESLFKNMGSRADQHLYNTSWNELMHSSRQAGTALAELQSRGLRYARTATHEERQQAIWVLKDTLDDISLFKRKLSKKEWQELSNVPGLNIETNGFRSIIRDFERSKPLVTYGFAEISGGHFVTGPRIGLVDTEMVARSFHSLRYPAAFASQERHDFFRMFYSEGLEAGLSINQVMRLDQTFGNAYQIHLARELSTPEQRFFRMTSTTQVIRDLLENHYIGEALHGLFEDEALYTLIDDLNTALGAHAYF